MTDSPSSRRAVVSVRVWALVGWTSVLWTTRLRNVLTDDSLSTVGRAVAVTIALGFLGGALSLLVVGARLPDRLTSASRLFAGVTIAWWAVRLVTNLAGNEGVAFKAVHTGLAVGSIALGAAVLAAQRDRLAPSAAVTGTGRGGDRAHR